VSNNIFLATTWVKSAGAPAGCVPGVKGAGYELVPFYSCYATAPSDHCISLLAMKRHRFISSRLCAWYSIIEMVKYV